MVNGCLMILRLRFVTYSALQGEPPPNPPQRGGSTMQKRLFRGFNVNYYLFLSESEYR